MQKLGKILAVVIVIVFGLGTLLGTKLSGCRARSSGFSTPALLTRVQALSELVTVKYVIEKVEVLEVPSENVVGQMLGSQNRMLLLAHGVVKAGIDLDKLKPEDIQVNGSTITLTLPKPRITDMYLDESQTKVIDRTTGLLAPPTKDLEQQTRRNALDNIQRAARSTGILSEAEQRARGQLVTLFKSLGFENVQFKTGE